MCVCVCVCVGGGGGTEDLPSIPVIFNPKQIKKHTRLMIMPDAELTKIQEDMNKEKVKQLAAESKAAASKKKASPTPPEGEKSAKAAKTSDSKK